MYFFSDYRDYLEEAREAKREEELEDLLNDDEDDEITVSDGELLLVFLQSYKCSYYGLWTLD